MNDISSEIQRVKDIQGLIRDKNFSKAMECCLEGLSQYPESANLKFLLALCDEGLGRVEEAGQQLEALLQKYPYHTEALYELGRLLLVGGNEQRAVEHFQACIQSNPNHAPSYTALARLQFSRGESDSAVQQLQTALRADSDYVPALTALTATLLDRGQLKQANEKAAHAITVAPEDPAAQLAFGQVMLAMGHLDFAEQSLSNAVSAEPDNPRMHLAMASLFQKQERHREALIALDAAERYGLDSLSLHRSRAQSLINLGRFQEAKAICLRLFEQNPVDESAILALTDIQVLLGDATALEQLIDQVPEQVPHLRLWVSARLALLRGEVEACLEDLANLLPCSSRSLDRRVRLLSAEIMAQHNQEMDAVTVLRPLISEASTDTQLTWQVARLARAAGDYEFAIEVLSALLSDGQPDHDVRVRTAVMLVDLYDLKGDFAKAAEGFSEASWQPPYLAELSSLEDVGDYSFERLNPWPWAADLAGHARPVFVVGWPFSGRDLIVSALKMAGLPELPPDEWMERRKKLGLPINPETLLSLDESTMLLRRRRYLRGAVSAAAVVEPGPIFSWDLPVIARLFPGATVVLLHAEDKYLTLQWRLVGFRQVPMMQKLWAHEQALLNQMRPELPLQFVLVELESLLTDPAKALDHLQGCIDDALQIKLPGLLEANTAAQIQSIAARRGYRPPNHWLQYASVLG